MINAKVFNRHLWTLVVAATTTCAWAQEPAKPALNSHFEKVEATVEIINPATREVTLRDAHGPLTVMVSPDVKNFDKMRVGDTLVVSYYQGFAAQMAKGNMKATEPAVTTFAFPAQGGVRPGGRAGASVTTTVTIVHVDETTHTVAFKGTDGWVRIIPVRSPNMQEFVRTLKEGDSVEVTYTESVAIEVVPVKG